MHAQPCMQATASDPASQSTGATSSTCTCSQCQPDTTWLEPAASYTASTCSDDMSCSYMYMHYYYMYIYMYMTCNAAAMCVHSTLFTGCSYWCNVHVHMYM